MLELELHRRDLGACWSSDPGGWCAGGSRVRPFSHPALESAAFTDGNRTLFVVRERCGRSGPPSPAAIWRLSAEELSRTLANAEEWSLDFLLLLIRQSPEGAQASLRCGDWGTAPLYLLDEGDTLWGHWDPARLFPRRRSRSLDPALAVHFLIHCGTPYSRRTLFPEVLRLTERAQGVWADRAPGEGLRIEYPSAFPPVAPGLLKRDVDVPAAFESLLATSMRRWLDATAPEVAAELSGGLDSALVAAVGSKLSPRPVRTLGLLMPGEPGEGQRRRRAELIERFGFLDLSFPGEEVPPFSPEGRRFRGERIVPWEEFYSEAFRRLMRLAADSGVSLIFTGVGGNELCFLSPDEMTPEQRQDVFRGVLADADGMPAFLGGEARALYRETVRTLDRAPLSKVPTSCLEAAASASALFLAEGIWPVNPLSTPELVRFCERLPREWREGRTVERRLLERLGCSPEVTHPRSTENFSPLMELALRRTAQPWIAGLFQDSRLAAAGLVEERKLIDSYARFQRAGRPGEEAAFYAAAVLEMTLRGLES